MLSTRKEYGKNKTDYMLEVTCGFNRQPKLVQVWEKNGKYLVNYDVLGIRSIHRRTTLLRDNGE